MAIGEVDDEDVALLTDALIHAGWYITKHSSKNKANEDLKKIMQALITAKVMELPVVSANALEPLTFEESLKELSKAIKDSGATALSTSKPHVKQFHTLGGQTHAMVVGPTDTEISITLRDYQIALFVNMLRGSS